MAHPLDQGQYINRVTGPQYRDPHAEMNLRMDMTQELDRILMGRDPQKRREDAINRMVADFNRFAEQDNVMTVEEFSRYQILYSKEMREKLLNNELSMEEWDMISDLSTELQDKYNPQKPTHIVDENGQDVCPPLPPIWAKLNFMKGNLGDIIDTFHTVHINDDGQNGGLNAARKRAATFELLRRFRMGQDDAELLRQQKEFEATARHFDQTNGVANTIKDKHDSSRVPAIFDPSKVTVVNHTATIPAPNSATPTANGVTYADDLEYAPVEDD